MGRFSRFAAAALLITASQGFADETPAVAALFENYTIKESAEPVRDRNGWRRPNHIVVHVPNFVALPVPDVEQWLQATVPGTRIQVVSEVGALKAAAREADGVVLTNCSLLNSNMAKLRWVQQLNVGVERCLQQPLNWDQLLLTNTAGMSGPFIAEHIIAMALMLTHKMPYYYRNQLEQRWARDFEALASARSVNGKTLLVLGLGGIGTQVAKKASALGMRVTAMRNSSRTGPAFVDYVGLSEELLKLTEAADFVVNTLPLTPKTTKIFDAEFFATMKPSAYFLNVGRGASVVTDDLVQALESGAIAGAALDVTDPEPLPASHVLWRMPNVLITPHSSSVSSIGSADRLVLIRENIRRYVNGEQMLNVVDPAKGY